MTKINVSLGVTIPAGEMGFVKPQIEILELDTEGDIDGQITESLVAASKAFIRIDEELETVVSRLLSPVTNKPSTVDRISVLESEYKKIREAQAAAAKRLRDWKPVIEKLITEDSSKDE